MAGINMQQLMKQAQQMQKKLAEAQESMNEVTVDASAGGGMVKVTVDGNMPVSYTHLQFGSPCSGRL